MGPLTVFCPRSRRPISSGIETDWTTILRLAPLMVRVACPECGENHDVRVSESHLARAEIDSTASVIPKSPHLERLLILAQSRD